jgi:rod shape-determining protein MreC
MEYSPPPLFKQGPSALARLIFFVVLAIALLVSDARFSTLEIVRGMLGAGLIRCSARRWCRATSSWAPRISP